MRKPDGHEPVQLQDFFKAMGPNAGERGTVCDVRDCTHVAFISVRVATGQRRLCLTHYEVLSRLFGKDSNRQRSA